MKWARPRQILHDVIYMWSVKKKKIKLTEEERWLSGAGRVVGNEKMKGVGIISGDLLSSMVTQYNE